MAAKLLIDDRNEVLAEKVKVADSFFPRFIGLMGRINFSNREALWLIPCKQVHTMFMFFPLDLLFLDEENVVLHRVVGLPPFTFSPRVSHARSVVELKGGTLEDVTVQVGEKLTLIEACEEDKRNGGS